jgi:hypothetical protein
VFATFSSSLYVLRMPCALPRRWQRYICSPAPVDAPYFTLLLVNKAAAPGVSSSSFEEVHFDNSCMGERQCVFDRSGTGLHHNNRTLRMFLLEL